MAIHFKMENEQEDIATTKKDEEMMVDETDEKKEKAQKKAKKRNSDEEKIKLAGFVKDEEIIYNLQHKLHSNGPALSAAWQRVATKMDKNGKYSQLF